MARLIAKYGQDQILAGPYIHHICWVILDLWTFGFLKRGAKLNILSITQQNSKFKPEQTDSDLRRRTLLKIRLGIFHVTFVHSFKYMCHVLHGKFKILKSNRFFNEWFRSRFFERRNLHFPNQANRAIGIKRTITVDWFNILILHLSRPLDLSHVVGGDRCAAAWRLITDKGLVRKWKCCNDLGV